jgi:restriction endonuclease S subunit
MSAFEEYEEAKFSIPLPPDQRVREAVMSILVKADAAIAELEAENETIHALVALQRERTKLAEAALAEREQALQHIADTIKAYVNEEDIDN